MSSINLRKAIKALGDIGMLGAENFFSYSQATLKERHGFGMAALSVIQRRQVAQEQGNFGMLGTVSFFRNSQAALVERLGFGMAPLVIEKQRQIIQACRNMGVYRAKRVLGFQQCGLVILFCAGKIHLVSGDIARFHVLNPFRLARPN
ncbi:MAG: hypothetical protein IT512_10960 [Rhodocyclaceae bacterium]|nr:hypothetical protein [Rhodocyclaceae bacterium]